MKTILTLAGITRKGKTRIGTHGAEWIVDEVRGTRLLLRPVLDPEADWRWICRTNDPNFVILKEEIR